MPQIPKIQLQNFNNSLCIIFIIRINYILATTNGIFLIFIMILISSAKIVVVTVETLRLNFERINKRENCSNLNANGSIKPDF